MTRPMPVLQPLPIKTRGTGFFAGTYRWLTAKRNWTVAEDWLFSLPGDGRVYVIPRGFVFDGASIPRLFWWFLSPVGILLIPGLIHDWCYRFDCLLMFQQGRTYTVHVFAGKSYWDYLFRETTKEVNQVVVLQWIVWLAVKLGGSSAWKKNRNRNDHRYWE